MKIQVIRFIWYNHTIPYDITNITHPMSSSAPQIFQDNDSKFGTLVAMKKPRLLEYLGSKKLRDEPSCPRDFDVTRWLYWLLIMIMKNDYDYWLWFWLLIIDYEFFPNDYDKPRSTHLFFSWDVPGRGLHRDPIARSPSRWAARCEICGVWCDRPRVKVVLPGFTRLFYTKKMWKHQDVFLGTNIFSC